MNNIPMTSYKNSLLGEEYRKYSHPSGLDIYIFPKKMTTAYAIFGTKYGSVHNTFKVGEGDFITVPDGIAHFLEHKLFACEDGSDAFERFSEYGADANAYTSFNKTCYLFSCTDCFEPALRELLSFVTHPYFTEASVASEVGIIAEEIKMYDDSPHDRCFYGMLEGLYEHHSIKRNICGTVESISQITPELLYACHDTFYRPSNMALVICGDVDDGLCLRVADEVLGISGSSLPPPVYANENEKEGREAARSYVEQHMQVAKPLFRIGFKDTDIPTEGYLRVRKEIGMAILDDMLFSDSGELYTSLLEENIISPSFSYEYSISQSFAYNSLSGEAEDPRLVLSRVLDFLADTKGSGLSEADFLRCKRVMYADGVRAFDSTDSIANNLFAAVCEDTEGFTYNEITDSITFEEVSLLFENAFDKSCLTLSVVLPIKNKKE